MTKFRIEKDTMGGEITFTMSERTGSSDEQCEQFVGFWVGVQSFIDRLADADIDDLHVERLDDEATEPM